MKQKIREQVETYKKFLKEEYDLFVEQGKKLRASNFNKFGQVPGKSDNTPINRHITEIPETLYFMISEALSNDEKIEFDQIKSRKWFAKEFPEFSGCEKI
jgi:hypothetical protein